MSQVHINSISIRSSIHAMFMYSIDFDLQLYFPLSASKRLIKKQKNYLLPKPRQRKPKMSMPFVNNSGSMMRHNIGVIISTCVISHANMKGEKK